MKSVILYASLLGAAMVASYLTWTADEVTHTKDSRKVDVYRASEGDVSSIFFDSEKLKVRVERRKDARGEYPWITIDETKETKVFKAHDHKDDEEGHGDDEKPEEGPEDTDAPAAEPEITVEQIHREFRGNDNADGLISAFEPLKALREFPKDAADPKVFGFDEPTGTITVTRKAGEVKLVLGGETYGARDRYAKLDDRTMLIASTAIKPLQFAASRTVERRLHPWAEQDLDTIAIQTKAGKLNLMQKHKADRKAAFWSRNGGQDADDTASTWVEKLVQERSDQHAAPEDIVDLPQVLSVAFDKAGTTHTLEFLRGGPDDEVYVKSSYLRGVTKLKKASALVLLADADELFQVD